MATRNDKTSQCSVSDWVILLIDEPFRGHDINIDPRSGSPFDKAGPVATPEFIIESSTTLLL